MANKISPAVFSGILSFVWDSNLLFTLADAIPVKHILFWPTVQRILDFPLFLCTDEGESTFKLCDELLDMLLEEDGKSVSVAAEKFRSAVKHVVIHGSGDDGCTPVFEEQNGIGDKIRALFKKAKRLRSINCENEVLPNARTIVSLRKHLESFNALIGDCMIPGNLDDGWGWGGDGVDALGKHFGTRLSYLHLERISIGMWTALEACQNLPKLKNLTRIYLDLTEGTWDIEDSDWPEDHDSETLDDYPFADIGLPALKDIKMRVVDLLLIQERPGIMDFTTWENVENLSLTVQRCYGWHSDHYRNIRVFNFLPPGHFNALRSLELNDARRWKKRWEWYKGQEDDEIFREERPRLKKESDQWIQQKARCYWGFVPSFLNGVRTGGLQNLTQLWVNERVLSMPKSQFSQGVDSDFYTVQELWERNNDAEENQRKEEWIAVIRAVFERLSSLRVGFGAMITSELSLILGCCSRDKLAQFGFQYLWAIKDKEVVIPSAILEEISRFPKLVDFHLLQPRPGTQETYILPSPKENAATTQDVVAIFKANPSLSYVGVANAVWERNCLPHSDELDSVTLAWDMYSDPRSLAIDSVPRFFQILHVDTYTEISEDFCSRESPVEPTRRMKDLVARLQNCSSD